jgi:hypothetical protein
VIWTLDLFFEAIDHNEARRVRADIEALLSRLTWQRTVNVGDLSERRPLVTFDEEDDDSL